MSLIGAMTTARFSAEVLDADLPVLADFWAPRCPPCLAIAPWLEELAAEYDGRLRIVKVNVDEERELIERYDVLYIPELIMFASGREVGRISGDQPRHVLRAALEHLLRNISAGNV